MNRPCTRYIDACESVGPEDRYLTERICTDPEFGKAVQRASENYVRRYGTPNEKEETYRELRAFAKYAAFGAWFHSPVHEQLKQGATIADLGCGAGAWLLTMAELYPNSRFLAIDIHNIFPQVVPKNVRFIQANILHGIPIEDGTVDFVHNSVLFLGLPLDAWPGIVAEATRILKPGGYYELTEANVTSQHPVGHTLKEMVEMIREIFENNGISTRAADRLPEVFSMNDQFEKPKTMFYNVPVGMWHGSWLGRQYSENVILVLRHVLGFRAKINSEKFEEDLEHVKLEFDENRYSLNMTVTYAQKKSSPMLTDFYWENGFY